MRTVRTTMQRGGGIDTSAVPHPPWRVPLIGDVLGVSPRTPLQDSMRLGRELGPGLRP